MIIITVPTTRPTRALGVTLPHKMIATVAARPMNKRISAASERLRPKRRMDAKIIWQAAARRVIARLKPLLIIPPYYAGHRRSPRHRWALHHVRFGSSPAGSAPIRERQVFQKADITSLIDV